MNRKIFVSLLLMILLSSGCGGHITYHNKKPDDAISRAIYEELGKSVYYQGKNVSPNNVLCYDYLIREESSDLLCKMIGTVNQTIEQEEIKDKIVIFCDKDIPGGTKRVIGLRNYSDSTLDYPYYGDLQRLVIISDYDWEDEDYFYNNPAVYTNIPGIKSLRISEKMQTKAEEQGIDWYEVWQGLEEVEVYYDYTEDGVKKEGTYRIEKE